MKKLYKKNKPMFFRILMIFWLAMLVLAFIRGWDMMSKLMCASLAASCFIFVGTSKKDEEWIKEHGDPDEFAKKMKEFEAQEEAAKAAAEAAAAAEASVTEDESAEEISAEEESAAEAESEAGDGELEADDSDMQDVAENETDTEVAPSESESEPEKEPEKTEA